MVLYANGRAIATKRIGRGWDKSVLAKKAGLNHSIVVRAEQGRRISPASATALADALGVGFF